MRKTLLFVVSLFVLLLASVSAQVAPTAQDIVAMSSASAPAISPDGKTIAYILTSRTLDAEAKPSDTDKTGGWKTERQLYVVAPDAAPRQLTFSKERTSDARWSPDGTSISFVRQHEGKSRLMVMRLDGGEPRVVDAGKFEPQSYAWSPDGKSIAFLATLPLTEEEKTAKWKSGNGNVYGGEWRPSQLFVVPVEGGTPRQVTKGSENISAFEWAPDGTRFAVVVAASADPYDVSSLQTTRVISATEGRVLRRLETEPKSIGAIHFSPDGNWVAYEKGEGTLSLLNFLAVRCVASKCTDETARNAAKKIDPTLAGFVWAADSKSILSHVSERTTSAIYRLSLDGATTQKIGAGDRIVRTDLSPDKAHRFIAFNSASASEPSNPTIFDAQTGQSRVVVQLNPQIAKWSLGKQEVFRWKNAAGNEIEGVLLVTPLAEPGVAPPLMVMPHGGPDSVTSNDFSSWANYFASHGFSVFRPNYRGSTGYGFDFYAANRGRLGEIELEDIESGVDALIAAGKADPNRLVYGGWSWGGYLTVYTIGHTNRYKAAVAGAAVVDTGLQYAMSDINHGVAAQWEFKGNPWLQPENFARANPLLSLAKVKTPTLIIHGEADDRVPLPNGIILFSALRDIGTPVRMLTYPDEPHGFTNPAHNAHMLGEWLAWYQKWVGKK